MLIQTNMRKGNERFLFDATEVQGLHEVLKKKDKEAARAWIHGKLLVAFLMEALILAGERFSPWGYPLCPSISEEPMPVEGDVFHATSLQRHS